MTALATLATEARDIASPGLEAAEEPIARERLVLERVIDDCAAAHELAIDGLRDAVVAFRAAFADRRASDNLLALARDVHFSLEALRQVEEALRHLCTERDRLEHGGGCDQAVAPPT